MSDPRTPDQQVEDLKRRQERQRRINAYHRVFGGDHEDGNLILKDLEETFKFSEPEFNGPDVNMGLVRSGQRRIKIHINKMLAERVTGDANLKPKEKVIAP